MDISVLEKSLESVIDWIIGSDSDEITSYIRKIRLDRPGLSNKQVAEIIINEQSINSGLLGAVTGFGGLITLPATIPIDLIKAWKIQAFTIRCIAHVYGYDVQENDLKTDIILVLSNGSIEGLKNLVIQEAINYAPKYALKNLEILKTTAIKSSTKCGTKYAAKVITKYGGKKLVNHTMKGFSKHLVKSLWKVGGKKIVEKKVQKAVGKIVPVVGAVINGGIDWWSTKAVGELAIEYYENSLPEWVYEVFNVLDEQ